MAHGSNQGAAAEPVRDIMLLADLIHLQQYLEHPHLLTAQEGALRIESLS